MQLTIKSAEDIYLHDQRWGNPPRSAAERVVLKYWLRDKFGMAYEESVVALPRMVTNKATTYARVDLGRWIVDCPWCKSAQHASKEDHRFFCVECGNAEVKGAWVPVHWPEEWRDIEKVLERRPDKGNQWWTPVKETLADLRAENKEHGVI